MPLFEVAILEVTKATKDKEESEKLVFGPVFLIAKDSQAAAMKTIFLNRDTISIDFDKMQVLVRPFA